MPSNCKRICATIGIAQVELHGAFNWRDDPREPLVYRFMVRNTRTGDIVRGLEMERGSRAYHYALGMARSENESAQCS